jgi:Acetyltransferase (GNAT) domain
VQSPLAGEISFRPLEAADFSTLAAWLAKPHVREFYQKRAVTLNEIAQEYGPSVRREEAGMSNLGLLYGAPFAYLQCYRNADYPVWMELIGVTGGISVDFYIGEQSCLHKRIWTRGASLISSAGRFCSVSQRNARLYSA